MVLIFKSCKTKKGEILPFYRNIPPRNIGTVSVPTALDEWHMHFYKHFHQFLCAFFRGFISLVCPPFRGSIDF